MVDEYSINLIHYDFGNVTDAWPYLEQICMYQCTNLYVPMYKFVIINFELGAFLISIVFESQKQIK